MSEKPTETEIEIEMQWMPVYWERLLAGTTYFDASEFGAYMLLIVEQWKKGSVPGEHKRLLKITRLRSKEKLETVLEKFKPDGKGNLINQVCDKIRKEQVAKYLRKSKQAKGAAEKRWGNNADGMRTAYEPHTDKKKEEVENKEIPKGIIHQQQAHEDFAKKIFTDEWKLDKENLELQLKNRREISENDVLEFNRHLLTEGKHHVHRAEYLRHLRNWLNTRPVAAQTKVVKLKSETDISSEDSYDKSKSVV